MASASSRWPLPATPAMPTISPPRTWRESPRSALSPRSPSAARSRASRTTGPGSPSPAAQTGNSCSPPIISEASSPGDVSAFSTVALCRPCRMTVTRSAISITSMSLWVMKTMAFPSSAMRRMTPKRSRTSRGVRTAVGSSMMRISAPRQRALTISTRCCSPTESCQMRACGWTGSPCPRAKFPMDLLERPGVEARSGALSCRG